MAHSLSGKVYNETVLPLMRPRADDNHDVLLDIDETTLNKPKVIVTKTSPASDEYKGLLQPPVSQSADAATAGEIEFRVGKDRQLMIGSKSKLAAVSPVFRVMFSDSQVKKQTIVDMPNFHTQSFAVMLRAASRDNDLSLTEDTVWHVLNAAHQFQILAVVTRCFHFLLHKHPQRHTSHHLCTVLEKAHKLDYRDHHASCLHRIKRHADKVFRSAAALSELCHECMLELVKADDLPVPEILVHDAVVTWARAAFRKDTGAEPGWEEMRAVAGQLVYQVRYLAMPRHVLVNLPAGQPDCLLRDKEKTCLLEGFVSSFPPQVATPRRPKGLGKESLRGAYLKCKERRRPLLLVVCSVLVLLLVFMVVCFLYFSPEVAAAADSASSESPDSSVLVLMVQEEQ